MISMMSQSTGKPNLDQEVFDGSITRERRQEARDAGNMDVADPMLDWVSHIISSIILLLHLRYG